MNYIIHAKGLKLIEEIDEEAIKSNTHENKQNFLKICELIFDLQTKTIYCPFMNISGHVNYFDIHITENKKDFINRVYNPSAQYFSEDYDEVIDNLEKLLNEEETRY